MKKSFLLLAAAFLSLLPLSAFPSTLGLPPSTSHVQTYDQLLSAIRGTRHASQARVEQAAQQEKVRESWEIGKLIDEHVLQHKRAGYGKQVLLRLSKDLGMSETELGYMLQFARTYPISRPVGKLSWSHYETLLSINDPKQREAVAHRAEKENWSRRRLQEEVRKINVGAEFVPALDSGRPQGSPLQSTLGKLNTYRIVKAPEGPYAGMLALDLGFSNWYKPKVTLSFEEGEIVTLIHSEKEIDTFEKLPAATKADLYIYRAYVKEVLDGDTVNAVIDLGFGFTTYQTLRLRGIDAPEIVSTEGKEAKAFLEKMLNVGAHPRPPAGEAGVRPELDSDLEHGPTHGLAPTPVLIRTTKSDKYDRYLADIFVEGKYINQELIEKGFAVKVAE